MREFRYRKNELDAVIPNGYVINIPENITSKSMLMDAYAQKAKLPDYFGRNWDALDEVLRDFWWISDRHISIVHTDVPLFTDSAELKIYLNILVRSINDWNPGDAHKVDVWFMEEDRDRVTAAIGPKRG